MKPLIAHLSAGADLDESDRHIIVATASMSIRAAPAHSEIVLQGETSYDAKVLLDGWAIRYRSLPDGHRQILYFLIPGDIFVASFSNGSRTDHSIASLTPVRYAEFSKDDLKRLFAHSPQISQAFQQAMLAELSVQREWTVSIGQRDARARIAHLLCEMIVRVSARGLGEGSGFPLPPTQIEIADALGLTAVHVNRMLQQLRKDGLIHLNGRQLIVNDFSKLASVAMFDPDYLLMEQPRLQPA